LFALYDLTGFCRCDRTVSSDLHVECQRVDHVQCVITFAQPVLVKGDHLFAREAIQIDSFVGDIRAKIFLAADSRSNDILPGRMDVEFEYSSAIVDHFIDSVLSAGEGNGLGRITCLGDKIERLLDGGANARGGLGHTGVRCCD